MLSGDSWSSESGFDINPENRKYFESKEKLYDAVVARAFDHLLSVFQGAAVETDSFESIVLGLTQSLIKHTEEKRLSLNFD